MESVTHTIVYTYNGDGVRVAQAVSRSGTTTVTQWVLDVLGLEQVLVERTDTSTVMYLYGLGRLAQKQGTDADWFLGDALGSVRQMADDDGIIVLVRDYGPYGQVIGEYGTGSSGYGYTGEQQDTAVNTALVFLRARYYAPSTGHFLSKDPWSGISSSPSTLNRYIYVLDNPYLSTQCLH